MTVAEDFQQMFNQSVNDEVIADMTSTGEVFHIQPNETEGGFGPDLLSVADAFDGVYIRMNEDESEAGEVFHIDTTRHDSESQALLAETLAEKLNKGY